MAVHWKISSDFNTAVTNDGAASKTMKRLVRNGKRTVRKTLRSANPTGA